MKAFAAAVTAVFLPLLAGCGLTPQGNLVRSEVASQGREAAATALENTEWALCRAMPVGAIKDRYGRSAELTAAYNQLCNAFSENFLKDEAARAPHELEEVDVVAQP